MPTDKTLHKFIDLHTEIDLYRFLSTRSAHMVNIVNWIRSKIVNWCISTTWWVSLLVDQTVQEDTCSQDLWSNSVDYKRFVRVNIDWNCNFVGLLHHAVWLQLILALFRHRFSTFRTTLLGLLMRVQYPKCADSYCELNPIQNGVYILVEVTFCIMRDFP